MHIWPLAYINVVFDVENQLLIEYIYYDKFLKKCDNIEIHHIFIEFGITYDSINKKQLYIGVAKFDFPDKENDWSGMDGTKPVSDKTTTRNIKAFKRYKRVKAGLLSSKQAV
jgi:hypothetical protein